MWCSEVWMVYLSPAVCTVDRPVVQRGAQYANTVTVLLEHIDLVRVHSAIHQRRHVLHPEGRPRTGSFRQLAHHLEVAVRLTEAHALVVDRRQYARIQRIVLTVRAYHKRAVHEAERT